jgi:hypothetical protein
MTGIEIISLRCNSEARVASVDAHLCVAGTVFSSYGSDDKVQP